MTGFWAWFHDGWEIVGAIAAAGAVIVALWLARHERTDRITAERARDAAEAELRADRTATREASRRAQAEHVIAWFERRPDSARIVTFLRAGNFSSAPVFDVRVTAVRLRDNETVHAAPEAVLPPMPEALRLRVRDVFEPWDEDIAVRMEFRDVAGAQWVRYSDGRLEEQPARS